MARLNPPKSAVFDRFAPLFCGGEGLDSGGAVAMILGKPGGRG